MRLIIAGDEEQARACANIKGLTREEWRRVQSVGDLQSSKLREGEPVLLFGSYRQRYVLTIREMFDVIRARGGTTEEVVDGRLTGEPRRQ